VTRPLLALLLVPLLAVAAPVPKGVKRASDAESLQGRWVGVTFDNGLGPVPDDLSWFEVTGDVLSNRARNVNEFAAQKFNLDPTHTPRRLDIDVGGGRFVRSIYQLDGDTLRWCMSGSWDTYPTEFKGGGGFHCYEFKRATVEEKKDK
jgi:uncharacterized protein (TIGR03067 family)